MTGLTLAEIAERLDAEVHGDASVRVTSLGALQTAGPDQLTFLANPRYREHLQKTKAGAVLCASDEVVFCPVPALVVKNPFTAFAQISVAFDPAPTALAGIHPSAVIAETAQIPASVSIGPNVVIEDRVSIGEHAVIMANSFIGAGATLGEHVKLWPNVTIYHGVSVGARTIVHASTVIGSDGFGFAPSQDGWEKIAQVGSVHIGADVEIGAGCTIDRGAIEDTVIEAGVIIDNQVHVAHNVRIGKHSALAGQVGIAGSTVIGSHCLLAGKVGLVGHIEVCDGVQLQGMSMVTNSITRPGVYASGSLLDEQSRWRKNAVRFRQLDELFRRVKTIEKARDEKS